MCGGGGGGFSWRDIEDSVLRRPCLHPVVVSGLGLPAIVSY